MAKGGPRWVETRMHTVRGHLGKDEVDEQASDNFSLDAREETQLTFAPRRLKKYHARKSVRYCRNFSTMPGKVVKLVSEMVKTRRS